MQNCAGQGIDKDQFVYHCRNRKCSTRWCTTCYAGQHSLQGVPKEILLHECEEIPFNGYGQAPDFLDPDCFLDEGAVPYLGSAPSDYFYTLGTAILGGDDSDFGCASKQSDLPADLAFGNQFLSPYGQHTLHKLIRLPNIISVPVLAYPPGGLGKRMGYLLTNAFWYMNVSLDRSTDCMKLYTLLFQLLPRLVLHDTRRLTREEGAHGETNRSTIMERLKLAE